MDQESKYFLKLIKTLKEKGYQVSGCIHAPNGDFPFEVEDK